MAAVPVTKIEFELTDVVVFGDGCGKEAGAGLIDVVDGCGRGDTTDPSPKAFRPRKLCNKINLVNQTVVFLSWAHLNKCLYTISACKSMSRN